jgi:hypothetical protein
VSLAHAITANHRRRLAWEAAVDSACWEVAGVSVWDLAPNSDTDGTEKMLDSMSITTDPTEAAKRILAAATAQPKE